MTSLGQGAPRIPLALLVRTGQGLLAGVGAPGRAGEGGVGGRFVHRVTFCAEGNESRSLSAQSVTLCTKCSPRRRTGPLRREDRHDLVLAGLAEATPSLSLGGPPSTQPHETTR